MKRYVFLMGMAVAFGMSTFLQPALAAEPKLVKAIPPKYPRLAERRGIEGMVTLEVQIKADGSVVSAEVVEADPPEIFDDSAIKAVMGWKFEPMEADLTKVKVPIKFTTGS